MTFDFAAFTFKSSFVKWIQTSLLKRGSVVLVCQDLHSASENEEEEEESASLWKSLNPQNDLPGSPFPTE